MKFRKLLIFAGIILFIASCKKDNKITTPTHPTGGDTTKTPPPVPADVTGSSGADVSSSPHAHSFLLLSSRITSQLESLETDVVAYQSQLFGSRMNSSNQ